jgi:hypothetical protein
MVTTATYGAEPRAGRVLPRRRLAADQPARPRGTSLAPPAHQVHSCRRVPRFDVPNTDGNALSETTPDLAPGVHSLGLASMKLIVNGGRPCSAHTS